jgi:hypothetical protein
LERYNEAEVSNFMSAFSETLSETVAENTEAHDVKERL